MKNKKLLAAATSVALVAVVGVGATLAYFTDNDSASNVVTMGHVDISLNESSTDDDGIVADETIPGEGMTFKNVMPGDVLSKNPSIQVENGSQDAYVRMKMEIVADDESGITEKDLADLEVGIRNQIIEGTDWTYDGIYYYYNEILSAGDEVDFFKTVTIPATWANNTADGTFNIKLTAEAIQADNVTPERAAGENSMIIGWPTDDIQQYTK